MSITHYAILSIKDKTIYAYVPIFFKWMYLFYIKEPNLKFVVLVPNVEHFSNNGLKSDFPCKKSSNLSFYSFQRGPQKCSKLKHKFLHLANWWGKQKKPFPLPITHWIMLLSFWNGVHHYVWIYPLFHYGLSNDTLTMVSELVAINISTDLK